MTKMDNFGINGRFLTQPMTGVQRYALNVTKAISEDIATHGIAVPLLVPPGAVDLKIAGADIRTVGQFGGHRWEQITLPKAWPDRLLNLCNTAPFLKSNQVICIHDANVFLSPESYSLSFKVLYKNLQPLIARRSARVTTVSAFSARRIAHHLSLKLSDIIILSNGHEHVYGWDPAKAIHAPLAIHRNLDGTERPFIIALGSRARHKNLRLLFQIAPALNEIGIDLIVVGGQVDIFAAETLQRSQNIKHLGFVTDHDLAYLFERALCLAFPSLTEGFGLPALEAMALGCPVIATDRASLPEICGHAAFLAPPDRPQQWVSYIKLLLADQNLRKDMIEKGIEQAKLFTWSNTAQGYLDLMNSPNYNNTKHTSVPLKPLNVAVVIATLGRPEVVEQTLRRILDRQSYRPTSIIISCIKHEDIGRAALWPEIRVVTGPPGLAAQRNTALSILPENTDIIVFFDDDFVPSSNWLSAVLKTFQENPDIVGVTGNVLEDGIKGPGLSYDTVDQLLSNNSSMTLNSLIEPYSPYGCNMAFRFSAIGSLRFDERLVLYGWMEDRDFGAGLAAKGGRLVKCLAASGVHMGVKSGRIPGQRLGYSQVINPLYLLYKGTMTRSQVFDHLFRNIASNLFRSISPEPFIDRRGRLIGNLRGIRDALLGRLEPERALGINKNTTKQTG